MRAYGWPERLIVWGLTLIFLLAGGAKIMSAPDVVAVFERFHLPHWFMLFSAGVEITGAIGLHLRSSIVGRAAPVLLAATMLVGAGFHLVYDPPLQAVPAIVLALLALTVLFLRRSRSAAAVA